MNTRHLIQLGLLCSALLASDLVHAEPGLPSFTGYLKGPEVNYFMREARTKLTDCYFKHIPKKNQKAGRYITVEYNINDMGKVQQIKVLDERTDLASKSFQTCISRAVSGVRYARIPKGRSSNVIYPLIFDAKGQPDL